MSISKPNILSPEGWNVEYKRLKGEFIKARSTGTLISDEDLRVLQTEVQTLYKAFQAMKRDLNLSVSHSEFGRMEVIIENLRKQVPLMSTSHLLQTTNQAGSASTTGSGVEMNSLSAGSSSGGSTSTSNPIQPAAGGGGLGQLGDKGLLQRQHEVIAQQNEALKDIEKGVSRLHEQAVDIGSEAKLHLHIISNLDTNVDAAADDLRAEAKHAETVRMKSRMCCLYLFLGMEVVLLVILLLVVFQYEGGFKPKGSNANGHSK